MRVLNILRLFGLRLFPIRGEQPERRETGH
jgi:hypothetical protein